MLLQHVDDKMKYYFMLWGSFFHNQLTVIWLAKRVTPCCNRTHISYYYNQLGQLLWAQLISSNSHTITETTRAKKEPYTISKFAYTGKQGIKIQFW